MPNTIKLSPPNLTLLLVHWGEYRSLGLRRTNLLSSQSNGINFNLSLKWIQTHISSVRMSYSVANFNRLILFFLEMKGFVEASRLFKFILLSLREIVCLDIIMPRLAWALFDKAVAVANWSFFLLNTIPSVFPCSSFSRPAWLFLGFAWPSLL